MNKQQNSKSDFTQSRKAIAIFFLMFFTLSFSSPIALVATPVAQAQCGPGGCGGAESTAGGLGDLLGGGGSMLELVGMIMGLLMQLLQGGGTPQQGTAEEKPAQLASGQERFTNGTKNASSGSTASNTGTTNTYNPASIPNTSLVIGKNITLPTTIKLKKGNAITISNSNTTSAYVIFSGGNAAKVVNETIESGQTKIFRFSNTGTYSLCTNASGVDQCKTSIVVSN